MTETVGILAGRLHGELAGIARRHLAREWRDDLEPCSLVNEAYLRLAHQQHFDCANDAHFLALASMCMGRVLIDTARRRCAIKRPQKWVELAAVELSAPSRIERTFPVREGLARLAAQNTRRTAILRLRFFDDLSLSEIGIQTGLSIATVKREMKAGLETLRSLLSR